MGIPAIDTVLGKAAEAASAHAVLYERARRRLLKRLTDVLSHRPVDVGSQPLRQIGISPDVGPIPGVQLVATAFYDGDAEGTAFRRRFRIIVPRLLHALDERHPSGKPFTHLAVNVASADFAHRPELQYDVTLQVEQQSYDHRVFHSWYGQHQFFIPLCELDREVELFLKADSIAAPSMTRRHMPVAESPEDGAAVPLFKVELYTVSQPAIFDRLAANSIWIFSSARSGSSWLAADLLGKIGEENSWRTIDESGIGRMYAPIDWAAERFYDLGSDARAVYIEGGFDFESYRRDRSKRFWRTGEPSIPVFERVFSPSMAVENQILSWRNRDFYHASLKRTAIEHVLTEWGYRDYHGVIFKCPNDSHAADLIMRAFPESLMIFLMRDGRDVLKSRFSRFGSEFLATTTDAGLRRYAISFFAHLWNFQVDVMRDAYESHSERRRLFLKYEDLRRDPRADMRRLAELLEVPISKDALEHIVAAATLENMPEEVRGDDKPRQGGVVGGHAAFFTDDEVRLMNDIMGENLRRYGYLQ